MTGYPAFTYQYKDSATEKVWAKGPTGRFLFSIWPYRLTRTLVAAVFLWSGGTKMMDPAAFAEIVEAYGLVPDI
ncbi:MAG: hypothetical protein GY849_11405, partial [Deltaproteobacteria bacterium]|nr:hypothetical protein [Deltaproteobacteria bacterium]